MTSDADSSRSVPTGVLRVTPELSRMEPPPAAEGTGALGPDDSESESCDAGRVGLSVDRA